MATGLSYAKLVDISTALSSQGIFSVLGVVVDVFQGPWKSKGTSSCITFTIKDSDLDNGHTWDGLKIKYFRDNASQLPPVQEGDVILLRNILVRPFSGKLLGVAPQDKTVPWALFRHEPDPVSSAAPMCGPTPFEPSFTEKRAALSLLEHSPEIKGFRISSSQPMAPQSHTVTVASRSKYSPRNCFTLIKDTKSGTYVDLLGEVVKLYPSHGDKVLMYVTDYTANKNLPDHEADDERGQEGDYYNYQRYNRNRWTGPSGQLSLAVTVWEPHADFVCDNVKEGDLVYLTNVHIRNSNLNMCLEATIHTGNQYDAKHYKVRLVNAKSDDRAKELLHRKEEYLNKNPSKRKLAEDGEPTARSKKTKKQQQKRNAEAKKDESQTSLVLKKRNAPNPNIIAAYGSCSDRSIEDIIANESHNNVSPNGIEYRFPFQNLCYRSIARVVDFFPPTLEDFAVPEREDDRSLTPHERYATGEAFNRWEWRFCLLVESSSAPAPGQAKEQMKLFVSDAEAVHLLDLDASDLRKRPNDLARLREKLFILWGDLEEQKRKPAEQNRQAPQDPKSISSRPFTCCIQEYGVKCSHRVAAGTDSGPNDDEDSSCSHNGCFGWERRFAMFRTKIK